MLWLEASDQRTGNTPAVPIFVYPRFVSAPIQQSPVGVERYKIEPFRTGLYGKYMRYISAVAQGDEPSRRLQRDRINSTLAGGCRSGVLLQRFNNFAARAWVRRRRSSVVSGRSFAAGISKISSYEMSVSVSGRTSPRSNREIVLKLVPTSWASSAWSSPPRRRQALSRIALASNII